MKFSARVRPEGGCLRALVILVITGLVAGNAAAGDATKNAINAQVPQESFYATTSNSQLARSGFERYYELDFDGAIQDFARALAEHPQDPFSANHLAEALFFKELYRAGAMETGTYTNNGFLNNRVPLRLDPAVEKRVRALLEQAMECANRRIADDPRDAQAYYARGVARGMEATYTALVKKSWMAALGSAKRARQDHERALAIDPGYSDARLVVGMHSYIVGSLPWALRMLAHVVGESGNKAEGLRDMRTAAAGNGEASTDAKVVLALFLRREQRYPEALGVERDLVSRYPRNFLFALEEANILKSMGKGPESIAAYQKVLRQAQNRQYQDPQLEFAYYGLGEAMRGQHDFAGAARAYDSAAHLPGPNRDMQLRALLFAGEMYDVLSQRALAVERYRAVMTVNADSKEAHIAQRNLKQPYHD